MSTLESRRFRTWQEEPEVSTPAWRIIAKYGFLRMAKTWYMAILLVLAGVAAIITIGATSYGLGTDASGVRYWAISAAGGIFAVPAVLLTLVIGSGLFAEDLRFRAPLFYFSRPIDVGHYMFGKFAQLWAVLFAFGFVPMVLVVLMANIGGLGAEPVDWRGRPLTGDSLTTWQYETIHGFGDWVYTWFFTLTGVFSSLFFFGTLMGFLSAITQRAWHAAMALVAVLGGWSILGASASVAFDDVRENLLHPFGWIDSVASVPLRLRFDQYYDASYGEYASTYLNYAPITIALSHLLLLGFGAVMLVLTYGRLRRVEGVV